MNDLSKKCDNCGEDLESSQYARVKKEGAPVVKAHENLVCRNYPACEEAEKEVIRPTEL